MHRLLDFSFGTRRYGERVARRLRAINAASWFSALFVGGFAVWQYLHPTPGILKVAALNTVTATALACVPLLHRWGPLAAPLGFMIVGYVAIFLITAMLGTDTGMQFQYLALAAAASFFFGTDRPGLLVFFGILAVGLIVLLEAFVPQDTGLLPHGTMFLNFVACTIGTCGILFFVMFLAVRGMDRAEAETERQYARSEALLTNILPASVANRLKCADAVIADRVADASILFADIAGFTARASDTNPEELVRFLNVAFSAFDGLVERHGLEKIKTAGDAYIVVSGVPESRVDHAQALAQFALDLRDLARGRVDMHGHAVPFRIGISSGPVVAGVVGTRRFFYDVWGDAVNVAARMESTGVEGEIHISDDFRKRLNEEFVLSDRGEIEVKGKGLMRTWLLLDHRGQRTAFAKAEHSHV